MSKTMNRSGGIQDSNKYLSSKSNAQISDQFSEGWERLSFPYVHFLGSMKKGISFLNLVLELYQRVGRLGWAKSKIRSPKMGPVF